MHGCTRVGEFGDHALKEIGTLPVCQALGLCSHIAHLRVLLQPTVPARSDGLQTRPRQRYISYRRWVWAQLRSLEVCNATNTSASFPCHVYSVAGFLAAMESRVSV